MSDDTTINSHNDDAMKFLLILVFGLFVLSCWLVCHFASPTTSLLTRLLVIISFTLGFAGVALLPIDLTITTVYDQEDDVTISPNATYSPWLITYWSTFVLAWTILPVVRESLLSGRFTFRAKLYAGCRTAVKGYFFLSVLGLLSLLGMAVKLHQGFGGVVPVLMAMGNTYGLLLVSLLLGYGLVSVPTSLWRQANPGVELQRIRIMAAGADEQLFEAVWELQDIEQLIDDVSDAIGSSQRDNNNNNNDTPMLDSNYARCVDILLTRRKTTAVLNPELQRRRTNTSGSKSKHNKSDDNDKDNENESSGYPNLEYLAKLNRRLQHAQNEIVSAEQRWNFIVQKSDFYNEIVEISSDATATSSGAITKLWYTTLRKPFYQLSALFCAILSGMILWSEATLSIPAKFVSPFAVMMSISEALVNANDGNLFLWLLRPLTALLPFVYMAWCVYGSLFKLSLFGSYQLRGQRTSSDLALLFNAQYLVRLQFPLGYNYLYLLKYNDNDTISSTCAFASLMKNMETVPFFGTSFGVYAPLLILALCGFTLFHGYARILSACGIDHEDAIFLNSTEDSDSSLETKVNEGITLLRRSRQQQQQQNNPSIQMTSSHTIV